METDERIDEVGLLVRLVDLAELDGIETLEALENAADEGRVPPIACVHHLRNGIVAEFVPQRPSTSSSHRAIGGLGFCGGGEGNDKLSPVAWFKYAPRKDLAPEIKCDPRVDYLSVELEHMRWGRVACVKLIACENLMELWEDDHDAPNIDIRKFVLRGVPVALDDFLSSSVNGQWDDDDNDDDDNEEEEEMSEGRMRTRRWAAGSMH